jgi:ribosome biogenesis GTPase A
MMRRYPEPLMRRYRLIDLPDSAIALLEQIARRLGCLVAGGGFDLHRAAEAFLRELRGGKLGRVSLEEPEQDAGAAIGAAERKDETGEVRPA